MALGDKTKTKGQVSAMTVITPIISGKCESLRALLATASGDSLRQLGTIRFARWVIIDNKQLLFTADFDGTWDDYLRDFIVYIPDEIDAIWNHCSGYPGCRTEEFRAYVDEYEYRAELYYSAHPDVTVKDLNKFENVYNQVDTLLKNFG